MTETIFAPATAPGRAGIAVIRISGPAAADVVKALTGQPLPASHRASLRGFYDCAGEMIDEGLVLWFPGPASFTGEDVAELHVHGGRAIIERFLGILARIAGVRLARPGEFTRRAVQNGKLDLTRAEAIADLVDAETEAQRRQAVNQYAGALYQMTESWRAQLIQVLAWTEAAIDFADDEVPEVVDASVRRVSEGIVKQMQALIRDSGRGEILREGIHLTVIGPPNAGKSSFVNALVDRDIAIVADTPGTTRDVVEVRLDLAGFPVIIADTAGLREALEAVEAEGVRRAKARARSGDLILLVLDGSAADPFGGVPTDLLNRASMTIWNKSDLPWPEPRPGHNLSLKTGEGMDPVLQSLTLLVKGSLAAGDGPVLTRARQREAVTQASDALERALISQSPELMAEDMRLALRAIGRLTGRVDVEDLLDVIFRDFCIGK